MVSLIMFAPNLETVWGSKRFLFYYLIAGIGGVVLYLVMTFVAVHYFDGTPLAAMGGASGCVFGIMAAFGLTFPETVLFPIPIKAKYYVIILGVVEFYGGVSSLNPSFSFGGGPTNIAHFAHLGGALFGILLIVYWNKGGRIGID
jgi:membrane associated rhomboid family serine protease